MSTCNTARFPVRLSCVALSLLCAQMMAGLVTAAEAEAPLGAAVAPVAATAQPAFDVWEFRVLGNTTLPEAAVEAVVYPFLGAGKTTNDVEAARAALEHRYRDAGYATVFVDIPEQKVSNGIVRLRVAEGRLDRVRITGARYYSNGQIRAALPALASGQVPLLPEVQAQLGALNRATADRSIIPVLKAGRMPGTVDVELKVKDTLPLHGSLELNDRYTVNTTRLRINAALSYDNLFQRQHSLALQYQTAPQNRKDVEAKVASYSFPVHAWGNSTVVLYAVDSNTDVATLGTLSVIGTGQIYGLKVLHSLPGSERFFQSMSLGVDYKDLLENIRLPLAAELKTPIQYLNWNGGWSGNIRSQHAVSSLNATVGFGVRGIANDGAEFENKRFKGAPNFVYLRLAAQQTRDLSGSLQLFGRVSAQLTEQPLVNSEQFAIGGVDTARGYFESSELGDLGYAVSFEAREGWPFKALGLPPGNAYLLLFYDRALARVVDQLPGLASRFDLASWGAGFRVTDWHGLSLSFDWAQAQQPSGTVRRGDSRVHFAVKQSL
jgi:hemolysin activation/secretion protein